MRRAPLRQPTTFSRALPAALALVVLAGCAGGGRLARAETGRRRTAALGVRVDVSGHAMAPYHDEVGGEAPRAALAELPQSAKELFRSERCPAEMALAGSEGARFCVDRWEATLVERSGEQELAVSPFGAIDGREKRMRAVSKRGVIPQGYISGQQAKLACQASGKRLCNPREWVRACRGPADTTFPYGEDRRAGVCNDDGRRRHPVAEAGKLLGIERDKLWRQGMNAPLINQLEETLQPTGQRGGCTNEWGVFDMVGNLHEWVDDPEGTFQGGYYMDTSKNGDGCKYATTAHSFDYHDYSTGFRCCMDAERVE